MSETLAPVGVETVLEAISAEMSIAAVACGHLDVALGKILEVVPAEHRLAVMHELHMVDMLAQHITAITDFTGRVLHESPHTGRLEVNDALNAITLGDVAARLRVSLDKAD
jgi:hypothetical protein